MNLPKQSGRADNAPATVRIPLTDRTEIAEFSHEFTLPDYLPEVNKMLRVTVRVLPPESYFGAGVLEFSGKLVYDVLYVGADGHLYAASLPEGYGIKISIDPPDGCDLSLGVDAFTDPVPDLIVTRVLSPRKLGIRLRTHSRIHAYALRPLEEETVGMPGGKPKRLYGTADAAVFLRATGDPVELGDEILDGAREGDPLRVIASEGRVLVSEAIPESDAVSVRGELYLKLLTARGEERTPSVLTRKLPFATRIELPSADRYCDARAFGTLSRIDLSVESGRILVDAELSVTAECQKNERLSYTRDLYSTERACELERITETLPFALYAENGNFTLAGTLPLSELSLSERDRILDVTGELSADSVTSEGKKAIVTGTGRFSVLTENGDTSEFETRDFTLPFRYVGDSVGLSDALPPLTSADVTLAPISIRAKSDGEKLGIDAEIAVSYRTESTGEITRVSSVRFGDPIPHSRPATVIAFPASGETLWETARRYHADPELLASRNGIDCLPDAPVPLRFLVIRE